MANNVLRYGFTGLSDISDKRVANVNESVIMTAIDDSLAIYNKQNQTMRKAFTFQTTKARDRVLQASGGYMEPLDAKGNPIPVKTPGKVTVGYYIQGSGTAFGTDRIARAKMTVREMDNEVYAAFGRDMRTTRHRLLAAILVKESWTFTDEDLNIGECPIYGLANGDTMTYLFNSGDTAVDNHYLGQAAAIADATNPFPTIYNELKEHPGNGTEVVVYVSSSLVTSILGLSSFVDSPHAGIIASALAAKIDPSLNTDALVGPGDKYLGWTDNCHIVEWSALPAGYMIARATGAGPFVGFREHPEAQLQGLFRETAMIEGSLQLSSFIRFCGFGVARRTAAVAFQVGSATYTTPTGYSGPSEV